MTMIDHPPPPPGDRAFKLKHLPIVAAREVTADNAAPEHVAAMVEAVAETMRRPTRVSAAMLGEVAGVIIQAPAPVIARALVVLVKSREAFAICFLNDELQHQIAIETAKRGGLPLPEFPPARWREVESLEHEEAEAKQRALLGFPT